MTIAETNVNIFSRVLDFDAILQLLEIGMYYQKKQYVRYFIFRKKLVYKPYKKTCFCTDGEECKYMFETNMYILFSYCFKKYINHYILFK